MTTTLNKRIDEFETLTKMVFKQLKGYPVDLIGRQHLTQEQLVFLANQSEEDYQASMKRLSTLLEAAE
jgi:hypothetical protein